MFTPDYRHVADVMRNRRPGRLPLYEHFVSERVMEGILDVRFAELRRGDAADRLEFYRNFCGFFQKMTYDTVSFEFGITSVLPGVGALSGGKPGPIQCRADYEAYPWAELPRLYWEKAAPQFDALVASLPPGMKAIGGVGNGVFEISEDLVGLEYLPYMQADYPEIYSDVYCRIGELMDAIWDTFLQRYGYAFVAGRFGDDLGFKSSLLTHPSTLRDHVFPVYKRIIDRVHGAGLPFLLHSCGCIFEVMDDILALGIDAKHSNEDGIAPFERWINDYGDRIGFFGGFDMDFLCSKDEDTVYRTVCEQGRRFRDLAKGFALGSGNSIPDYVPVENYLAMIRGAQTIRAEE